MDTLSDSNCQRDNEINETKSPKNRFAGTISTTGRYNQIYTMTHIYTLQKTNLNTESMSTINQPNNQIPEWGCKVGL